MDGSPSDRFDSAISTQHIHAGYDVASRVTKRAVTTEPSPSAIGGQSSMAVTNASPETSSSGRFSGSIRPAHRPLANIHERGRMISASTMPPSLRSTVMDNLAHDAWLGSDISVYQRFKKPDR